jgi:acetyl-CoA C-acetyltransferase
MKKDVAIISYAHEKYGRLEMDTEEIIHKMVKEVLNNTDKGIYPSEIDWIIVSCVDNQFSNQHQTGTVAWEALGNKNARAFRVEAACCSGSMAVYLGREFIRRNIATNVLVIGFEKMSNVSTEIATGILMRGSSPEERRAGITQPAAYALMIQHYMKKYGATEEDFAMVSVKNHENALRNPWAHFHRKIAIEDVLNSRIIATPIRLLHCCPISDGAAAIILSGNPRKYTDAPVYITGMGMAHDAFSSFRREDPAFLLASKLAADEAYKEAEITPSQIDIAEVHDAFTPVEPMCYEALGLAERGEGYKLIREGRVMFHGDIPVNVSGGLKAKGHPVGATGIGMIVEQYLQLRGEAGERQVPNVEIAVVENHGGTGSVSLVTVLTR